MSKKSNVVKRPRKAAERGTGRNMKTTGFSLQHETINRLNAWCADKPMSKSYYVEQMILAGIEKQGTGESTKG